MYEIQREPLITGGVLQLQRVINHTRTNISRNVHMAGFPQRSFMNAAPPGYWADSSGARVEQGTPGASWTPTSLPVGAGTVQFIQGNPIYDAERNLVGYTTASSVVSDPVQPDGLITVRDSSREALLEEVHQLHVSISSDATASGESRKQARAEYEADLGITAQPVNDGGRWGLQTALDLGSTIIGSPRYFAPLRPEFAARVDAGPISAEEQKENRANYEAGLLSQEGAMEANGVADVVNELARINAEAEARAEQEEASLARLSSSVLPAGAEEEETLPPADEE
jgi:hypothetical protein